MEFNAYLARAAGIFIVTLHTDHDEVSFITKERKNKEERNV
jgi:hypothetical protein